MFVCPFYFLLCERRGGQVAAQHAVHVAAAQREANAQRAATTEPRVICRTAVEDGMAGGGTARGLAISTAAAEQRGPGW